MRTTWLVPWAIWLALTGCDGGSTSRDTEAAASASADMPAAPAEPGETNPGAPSSANPATADTTEPAAPRPDATVAPPNGSPVTTNPSEIPEHVNPTPVSSSAPEPESPPPQASGAAGFGGGPSLSSGGEGQGGAGGNTVGPSGAGASSMGGVGGAPVNTGEPAVHFVGRFSEQGGAMRFEWSGSGMVAAFEGEQVAVTLDDTGSNQFTVVIDGEERPKLVAQGGQRSYELASGLPAGRHTVELYRRTEASFGPTSFLGFDFGDGELLPPPARSRKLELIGDSITCGYGNEGESATCGFSADTENHYATYGAIAARALDAELVTIAWSGKGIVYNYDTDTNQPLPELYDLTLPQTGGVEWDFSVIPDAVVINLGTNDFSTDGDPTPELFTGRYVELLAHLRDVYPTAYILCTVGPLLNGSDLQAARAGIADAVATRQGAGDERVDAWEMNISNDDPGCDYHPGLETHQRMADALVSELSARLDW